MSVLWIGDKIEKELENYVLKEFGIPGKKLQTEVARKAIIFSIRMKSHEFKQAWTEGLLEYDK